MAEVRKKKVLIFIDWYLPGLNAGGPVRTCANMVSRLNDEFDFFIVTRNTDLKDDKPYQSVIADAWNVRDDGSQVYYFSKENLSYENIKALIHQLAPDAIHLNSLYSYYFTVLPLRIAGKMRPSPRVVLGPRGMLSKGALAIKPFKKKIFLSVAKITGLFNNVTWHASTPVEQQEIKNHFGNVNIQLGIDLAAAGSIKRHDRIKIPGQLSLFYLGRISPVKNPYQCLEILHLIPGDVKINFDIFGPVEDNAYWEQCQNLISKMPSHLTVNYKGAIANDLLADTLHRYHFLFLLSENENYGHAIIEAMSAGCPVIIGNRTPWRNLESEHAGFDIPLEDNNKILDAVKKAAAMDQQTYNRWSAGAYTKAENVTGSIASVEDNKNLFR